jgi:hypothetical protein
VPFALALHAICLVNAFGSGQFADRSAESGYELH